MSSQRMSLLAAFKKEFRLQNLSLSFEKNSEFRERDPEEVLEYFHSSIWPCCNRLVYVIYRVAIAFYYTIWLIESIVRNAEFRSKDYKITNKEKTNIFSIHPWPFYMTSWSLTILFFHLWITAFITLYFYSINKKSMLASFFAYIFGPFSCSRSSRSSAMSSKAGSESSCLCCPLKRDSSPTATTIISKPPSAEETGISLLSSGEPVKQAETTIEIEEDSTANTNENSETSRTYCDNKAKCQLPSASVASDAVAWKLWVDTHVPCAILYAIKISWLLYNLVAVSAIVVTVVYFSYVYFADLQVEPSWIQEIGNVHRHGINSLVAIVDVLILAYPVRLLHFVYVNVYGWLYAFVTFIYWIQNPKENVIYDQIDYNKPVKLLASYFFLTVMVVLLQTFHFLAYRFKVYVKETLVRTGCFGRSRST